MFIILLIVAFLFIGAVGIRLVAPGLEVEDKDILDVGILILGLGTFVLLVVTTLAIVGTKEVGILTSFNRPIGTLDNGLHFKAPWQGVTEMDAAIQTDNHVETNHNCISARIAHQIVGCVDVTIRWRIHEGAADALFQNYRDFDNVRSSLVTRELATNINSTLADYDPLAVDANGNSISVPLNTLSAKVLAEMRTQVGAQVEVLSVFVPVIHFDAATQGRLNALQAQIAQTRIADQAVKTAQAQSQANQALAASVSTDPNVLVSKCLDILSEMVNKGQAVPAGFSCWQGGGTGIVLPQGK